MGNHQHLTQHCFPNFLGQSLDETYVIRPVWNLYQLDKECTFHGGEDRLRTIVFVAFAQTE